MNSIAFNADSGGEVSNASAKILIHLANNFLPTTLAPGHRFFGPTFAVFTEIVQARAGTPGIQVGIALAGSGAWNCFPCHGRNLLLPGEHRVEARTVTLGTRCWQEPELTNTGRSRRHAQTPASYPHVTARAGACGRGRPCAAGSSRTSRAGGRRGHAAGAHRRAGRGR